MIRGRLLGRVEPADRRLRGHGRQGQVPLVLAPLVDDQHVARRQPGVAADVHLGQPGPGAATAATFPRTPGGADRGMPVDDRRTGSGRPARPGAGDDVRHFQVAHLAGQFFHLAEQVGVPLDQVLGHQVRVHGHLPLAVQFLLDGHDPRPQGVLLLDQRPALVLELLHLGHEGQLGGVGRLGLVDLVGLELPVPLGLVLVLRHLALQADDFLGDALRGRVLLLQVVLVGGLLGLVSDLGRLGLLLGVRVGRLPVGAGGEDEARSAPR